MLVFFDVFGVTHHNFAGSNDGILLQLQIILQRRRLRSMRGFGRRSWIRRALIGSSSTPNMESLEKWKNAQLLLSITHIFNEVWVLFLNLVSYRFPSAWRRSDGLIKDRWSLDRRGNSKYQFWWLAIKQKVSDFGSWACKQSLATD